MKIVNLLPGPVNIREEVKKEYEKPAVSHRGRGFINDFNKTRDLLCKYVNASSVEIFTGSGTLANEVIAAQISNLDGRGLMLVSGEFSGRLVKIAERHGLDFKVLRKEWGETFSRSEIEEFLDKEFSNCTWLWTVHCETSTGVLNDLRMLKGVCSKHNIKLCLDCISSIATIPLELSDIYLASSSSGKAIGAYPGLSMVFYNHHIEPSEKIPIYFDLGYYNIKNGIPFTIPSNAVYALKKAVELLTIEDKFEKIEMVSSHIREKILSLGIDLIVSKEDSSPAVITFTLPKEISSKRIGEIMGERGYQLSFNSYYLIEKNWIQICLMGNINIDYIKGFKSTLQEVLYNINFKGVS